MGGFAMHRLYEHQAIALDVDNTLIDHPKSPLLQDFVISEYQWRCFFIVTHRSAKSSARLWRDLYHDTFGRLGRRAFAGVVHLPLDLYDAWCDCCARRERGELAGRSTAAERAFIEWKARRACQYGCTVLVDDCASLNRDACRSLGVVYIATDWL